MATLKRKAPAASGSDAKKPRPDSNIMSFFGAPKPAAAATAAPAAVASASSVSAPAAAAATGAAARLPAAATFNKDKWAAGLTAEQRDLLKLEIDTLDPSWLGLLKDDVTSREFLELKRFLGREAAANKKVFPPPEDIYSWSRHTPFHSVKVVIIGQDPYHNFNQAHGLAFSVRPPTAAPPSLKNMYTCLQNDYPTFRPPPAGRGLLTPWADRGVLMLNTCLTVRAHEPKSHANRGWERFTQRVIDLVAARRARGVVFMAWGTPAGKCVTKVDQARHLVLRAVHPSPLSASRGFFGCGHFRKANDWLAHRYGDEAGYIDWSLTEGVSLRDEEGQQEEGREKDEQGEKAGQQEEGASDEFDEDPDAEEMMRLAEQAEEKAEVAKTAKQTQVVEKEVEVSKPAKQKPAEKDGDAHGAAKQKPAEKGADAHKTTKQNQTAVPADLVVKKTAAGPRALKPKAEPLQTAKSDRALTPNVELETAKPTMGSEENKENEAETEDE